MPETCTHHRPHEFAARLRSRPDSTPLARLLLRAYLSGMPQGERYSDISELLLGELFANAVQHSDAPPDRLVELRFALVAGRLRIEVHDAGSGRPTPAPPPPTTSAAAGSSSSTSSPSAGVAALARVGSASSSGR
ncbi:ATP-binding protein [Kitasatospora aburaviensis]